MTKCWQIRSKIKLIGVKIKHIIEKYVMKKQYTDTMNPFEYWYSQDEKIREFLNTYYRENEEYLMQLENNDISQIKNMFEHSNAIDKMLVLTAIAGVKKYMSSKKQELMSKIRWIIDKGAVHILGTNVVNKVLSFFTNIFIVRFLTKSEYGIFGYANNIISFFLLVSGLGMLSGVLQYGSENRSEEEKKLYFKYGMNFGLIINGILALLVFLYVKWVPVAIGGTQNISY